MQVVLFEAIFTCYMKQYFGASPLELKKMLKFKPNIDINICCTIPLNIEEYALFVDQRQHRNVKALIGSLIINDYISINCVYCKSVNANGRELTNRSYTLKVLLLIILVTKSNFFINQSNF